MSVTGSPIDASSNHVLSMLPAEAHRQLTSRLQLVHTEFKQVIFQRDQPIEYVYFPVNSGFSVLTILQNGTAVEIGTIGNEGFAGIDLLMGSDLAMDTVVCQVEGDSFRMRAADFKEAVVQDASLRRIAQQFLRSYVGQISQSVACNRLHTIEQRFSRWVLITHHRVKRDRFHLTQEFLADMLGVHRPSVSIVASAFQQAGLIQYSRGNLTILNRAGLEATCCECYAAVKRRTQQILGLERG